MALNPCAPIPRRVRLTSLLPKPHLVLPLILRSKLPGKAQTAAMNGKPFLPAPATLPATASSPWQTPCASVSIWGTARQYDGYEQEQPRDPRICSGWYQAGWLPFAAFSAPDLLLIADHSPTASGQCGQIIAFSHDPDTISYVCTDFATLLEQSLATIREHPEDCLPEE